MQYLVALEKYYVTFPGLGWKFNISNAAIDINGFVVYWYGMLIAFAVALCLILGMKQCRKHGLTPDLLTDYCLLAIPFAFIGARLYYVFCQWSSYYVKGNIGKTLSNITNVREGGLAIYGGVLGAAFAIFLMSKIRKIPMAPVIDFAMVYIPLGQAIGRWGNFFNQEAFGTTTDLPWGMKSAAISRYLAANCPNLDSNKPVHPTFFYESVACLIICIILFIVRSKSKKPWTVTSCYCIGYGIVRFFIEGLRTDSLYIGGTSLRISQVLSLVLIVLGFLVLSLARIYDWEKKPIPERFFKADEQMQRDAKRRREEKLARYAQDDDDEDDEDRVERLAKSSFTVKDEDADEDESDETDASDEDSEEDSDEDSEEADISDDEDSDEESEEQDEEK
ncbi:MAG: prolipoprotein diacylglyceryl transferase [Clostridiales bacterium]|nr:prolipoprotein diacylglyceryl transferase [Clostridiales bacterium]MBQ6270758.1 prolipoprotein diacylglyceryl transferase [Clostridiales bacterium]